MLSSAISISQKSTYQHKCANKSNVPSKERILGQQKKWCPINNYNSQIKSSCLLPVKKTDKQEDLLYPI